MSPDEALAVAERSTPAKGATVDAAEPNGLRAGQAVEVVPDDYGFDPVRGELVASSADEVAILRRDERLGEIAVHFPRIGFRVTAR